MKTYIVNDSKLDEVLGLISNPAERELVNDYLVDHCTVEFKKISISRFEQYFGRIVFIEVCAIILMVLFLTFNK